MKVYILFALLVALVKADEGDQVLNDNGGDMGNLDESVRDKRADYSRGGFGDFGFGRHNRDLDVSADIDNSRVGSGDFGFGRSSREVDDSMVRDKRAPIFYGHGFGHGGFHGFHGGFHGHHGFHRFKRSPIFYGNGFGHGGFHGFHGGFHGHHGFHHFRVRF